MAGTHITLTLEGPNSEDGHVRLRDFVAELQALRRALLRMERMASGDKVRAYYRVVGLRHESPAVIEVERVERGRPAEPAPVIDSFFGAVREIELGEAPDADRELLSSLKTMAAPVGKHVRSAVLQYDAGAITLTPQLHEKVSSLLVPEISALGSVSGRLERINFHASANTFHIYPMIGPKRVACRFSPSLTERAEKAVNRYVTVHGELRYKSNANFPYFVDVSDIQQCPPEDELPRLGELRGSAPDATEDLTTEEFVWRVRDEW